MEETLKGMDEQERQDQTTTSAATCALPARATTPLAEPRITIEMPVVRTQQLAARARRTMPLTEGNE
ncbi:MAG: hypothetical protein ACREAB_05025 [Blastocatellia bacterium]